MLTVDRSRWLIMISLACSSLRDQAKVAILPELLYENIFAVAMDQCSKVHSRLIGSRGYVKEYTAASHNSYL